MATDTTTGRSTMTALVVAARPRQWVKNLLVVAAPGAAGVLLTPEAAAGTLLALLAMTAAAAATYLLNDVRDRAVDAAHPVKRHRPIAAGELAPPTAVAAAVGLASVAVVLPVVAGRPALTTVVLAYLALTAAYSAGLKRVRLLELLAVAAGFVLRAVAGAAAVDVPVSEWFLIVVSAVAVHVVATKRWAELRDRDGSASRRVLARYTDDVLREIRYSSIAVALVGYLLWAFQIHEGGVPWHPLSSVPFALALFEYGAQAHDGAGEAPEEILLRGGPVLAYSVVWAVLFGIGVLA